MSDFNELIAKVKDANNILEFNEMQILALKEEYCDENLIIASPTSSGKTLVAEIYLLYTILIKHKRAIFISPLKALTSEHYNSFKKKYESFGLKIGISTGDLDSSSKYLENYQIIFLTFEKLDSLIRHRASWLHTLGLLVIDEIHNIDSDRGATLETTVVELKQILPSMRIIGLSATIPNASQLASWINGKLIYSEYRPVKLKKGILFENKIKFDDNTIEYIQTKNNSIEDIVIDTLEKRKQALVFTNTRKNSEGLAKKLQNITKNYLDEKEKKIIAKAIDDIDYLLTTDYDKDVANNLLQGASFHHAGLRDSLRNKTEELFKQGALKILVSTPTLAAGVNLPAYRVIIHTVHRHTANGMLPIPVKEYVQMSGRAGRQGYDTIGESILIAKDDLEEENLFEKYVYALPEDVESQLGYVPVLRTQLLSIIANEIVFNDESLEKFFNETFYAIRFGDINSLMQKIETLLRELINSGFVKIDKGVIKATEIGKRISELYIDPLSAYNIIEKIKNQDDLTNKEFLMIVVNTIELKPYFMPGKNRVQQLEEQLQDEYKDLGINTNELWDDHEIIEKYYTMTILNDWISEVSEQDLLNNYDILPGTLHNKLYNTSWICYAIGEIAKVLDKTIVHKQAILMEKRIKQGVKEELLLLTELPNIGRARARKLYQNHYRTVSDVKSADPQILINILGLKIAQKLLEHLKVEFDINTIFIKQESTEEHKILKKDESKATKKITKKKIKTEAKLQKSLFEY